MSTNKSILGSSFDDFVSKQLDIRTKLLSSNNDVFGKDNITRDLDTINYAISKTAFIRLSSGVNIESEEMAMFLGKKEYQGDGLAKAFILQGGTLNNGALRGGLSGPNSAYTVGATNTLGELGLRPMPGITSINVSTKGRWGSLRETTINIKCFDRNQLSIIETLYLRPGYTILLEWGNTLFYNNDNKLINSIKFIDFFDNKLDKNGYYQQILKKREEYSGNYDAFIGPVLNFSIRTNHDGTYDCVVKAISWGTIIDSLKINTSSNISKSSASKNKIIGNLDQSEEILAKEESVNDSKLEAILNIIYKTCDEYVAKKRLKEKAIRITNVYEEYFDTNETGYSVAQNPTKIDPKKLTTFSSIVFKNAPSSKIGNDGPVSVGNSTYISLGSLLSIISRNCLLYSTNQIGIPGLPSGMTVPIININFNPSDNFCFSPDNHISIDPNICMIKYEGSGFNELGLDKNVSFSNVNKVLPTFKKSNLVGYTMNIMININHLLKKLNSKDAEGKIDLYDFLDTLMDDINFALGRVNDFNVGIDDETNTLMIYDNQILENSPKEVSIINTFGLKTSAREISLESRINNDLASLIAIGAQAGGEALGLDGAILSEYNRGLKDRISPNRIGIDSNTTTNAIDYKTSLSKDSRAETIKQYIQNIYINNLIASDTTLTCKSFYADIINILKSKEKSSISIIPFIFNIKLDGISGISYGQLFSIEPIRLPKNYILASNKNQPLVAFLVSNIEQNVELNVWTTGISGQMAPIRNLKIKV